MKRGHPVEVHVLQPVVVGDALHDLCIGVDVSSTKHTPEAFRWDQRLIELLSFTEVWHLGAEEVESYVVQLLGRFPL